MGVVVLLLAAGCFRVARPPEAIPEPEPTVRTAKLIFIGDVMSHTPQVAAARAAAKPPNGYDYTGVFRQMRPIFGGNGRGRSEFDCATHDTTIETVVVANLETTLRTSPPYTGYPTFAAPAELAFAMRAAGIHIATTANNHICDKGARGIRSTLALLDSAGLRHTGAFADSADLRARNPLRFTAGGLRFALLNYTYGTNGIPVPNGLPVNRIDTAAIARDLVIARDYGTDCVIVSYHWGDEYRRYPAAVQKELAEWTRAHGADLIIGGHPHVVQPPEAHYSADSTEVIGATYYSLGNFVSNQRGRYTDGGMAAEITVTKIMPAPGMHSVHGTTPDSLAVLRQPLHFDLGYRLFWVGPHYAVLPSAVLDTIPLADPARLAADQFLRDTRELLSETDPAFTEYK